MFSRRAAITIAISTAIMIAITTMTAISGITDARRGPPPLAEF
jgi:hypothetical protein